MRAPINATRDQASEGRRGSVLLLSFLMLLVLLAIMTQLKLTTHTEVRVAENDVSLTAMDLAIEAALLEIYENLIADGEAGGGGGAAGDLGGAAGAGGGGAAGLGADALGGAGGGGGESESSDSREDDWSRPQRTTIGEVDLRILIQDEESKINVLGMLAEDEDEAKKAFERVVRVIEYFRADTEAEVDGSKAERMAEIIRDSLTDRRSLEDDLPIPTLLTRDEENEDRSMPLSLREFVALEPFHAGLFRDYRDDDENIVHSLTSYLTVYSSVGTFDDFQRAAEDAGGAAGQAGGAGQAAGAGTGGAGQPSSGQTVTATNQGVSSSPSGSGQGGAQGAGAAGGDAGAAGTTQATETAGTVVNINTAPPVVLKALIDDRDVDPRFWDRVIEYRNTEEEPEDDGAEEIEPIYDEFGNEELQYQIFDNLQELAEVDGWLDLEPVARAEVGSRTTVSSNVFSIFITARIPVDKELELAAPTSRAEAREQEENSGSLTRTIRSVVWRRQADESWEIVPIIRWEVIDYSPYEVLDDPEEDR